MNGWVTVRLHRVGFTVLCPLVALVAVWMAAIGEPVLAGVFGGMLSGIAIITIKSWIAHPEPRVAAKSKDTQ